MNRIPTNHPGNNVCAILTMAIFLAALAFILNGCAFTDWITAAAQDPAVIEAAGDLVETVPDVVSNPLSPTSWAAIAAAVAALVGALFGVKKVVTARRAATQDPPPAE